MLLLTCMHYAVLLIYNVDISIRGVNLGFTIARMRGSKTLTSVREVGERLLATATRVRDAVSWAPGLPHHAQHYMHGRGHQVEEFDNWCVACHIVEALTVAICDNLKTRYSPSLLQHFGVELGEDGCTIGVMMVRGSPSAAHSMSVLPACWPSRSSKVSTPVSPLLNVDNALTEHVSNGCQLVPS
jgi:hypothetical protein